MAILVCMLCAVARAISTPSIVVGKPQVLMSNDFMAQSGYAGRPDASLYAIKRTTGYQFFVNNGPAQPLGGPVQSVMSNGGSGRLNVTKYENSVTIDGYPCPPGFDSKWGCQRGNPRSNELWLNTCKDAPSQRWNFSAHSNWTNVKSLSNSICMTGLSASRQTKC